MSESVIKKGAIISYVSIFLNIGISLIYMPWMIKEIGISEYGIYTLILSFISYFLLDFGLGSAISRFIAKYRAEGNEGQISNMLGITTRVYFFIDVIIFLVLVVSYFFLSDIFVKLTPDEIEKLERVYLIAGFFSVCTFIFKPMDGAMLAYEYFVRLKLLDMLQRVGTVLLIVVALLFNGGLYALVLVNGIVALVVSFLKFRYFIQKSKIKIRWNYFDKTIARQLFVFSFWVFMIGLAQRFRLNAIPSVLGIFSGTSEISIFSIGISLEGIVFTFAYALNGLFIPKVARMMSGGADRAKITDLMIRVGRIQLYIIGFIIIGFIGLGKSFLQLWLGDDFSRSYYVVVLLIVPNIVSMTQQIGTTLSYVENEIRYNAIIAFTVSFMSLIFAVILAKKYGATGCASAVFIALLLNNILINIFYKKVLKLDVIRFFKNCHLRIIPYFILWTCVLVFTSNHMYIDSWVKLFVIGTLYMSAFFAFLYIVTFNKEEKELVKSVLTKLKL